ncbi:MAG: hypothetical protein B6I35_10410 [Anaerolineaceae bacterium 4572_32.2]|nr:MAG: hypothetical protein B6I35_10410 [Anaerolineaceae bacterium 4572_32.2]
MIQDVQVIPLATYMDDRGFLTEIIRVAGGDEPHAIAHKFGQVYLVGDPVRGSIRAYHKHAELWDWFCIVHGTAKFVLVDDREDSPTKGEMMTIVTGERAPKLVVVPPGVYGRTPTRNASRLIRSATCGRSKDGSDAQDIAGWRRRLRRLGAGGRVVGAGLCGQDPRPALLRRRWPARDPRPGRAGRGRHARDRPQRAARRGRGGQPGGAIKRPHGRVQSQGQL